MRLEWALSASARMRTAFLRTVSIVESRLLVELCAGFCSGSDESEGRGRFGPEQIFPVAFAMWLLLVLT